MAAGVLGFRVSEVLGFRGLGVSGCRGFRGFRGSGVLGVLGFLVKVWGFRV